MQLGDVVKVVGSSQLKDFPWGQLVVDLVNSFLSDANQLTPLSNGEDLSAAMASMSPEQQQFLLAAAIDVKRVKLTVPSDSPVVTPPANPVPPPAPPETPEEKKNRIFNVGSLVIMIVFCGVAVVLWLRIDPNTPTTAQDAKDYLGILADMVKTYLGSNPPPAPPSP